MTSCKVISFVTGEPLEAPRVPTTFASVPRVGELLVGADNSRWEVARVEHAEAPPELTEPQRVWLEHAAGLPNNPIAGVAQAQLHARPQCRVVVLPARKDR